MKMLPPPLATSSPALLLPLLLVLVLVLVLALVALMAAAVPPLRRSSCVCKTWETAIGDAVVVVVGLFSDCTGEESSDGRGGGAPLERAGGVGGSMLDVDVDVDVDVVGAGLPMLSTLLEPPLLVTPPPTRGTPRGGVVDANNADSAWCEEAIRGAGVTDEPLAAAADVTAP